MVNTIEDMYEGLEVVEEEPETSGVVFNLSEVEDVVFETPNRKFDKVGMNYLSDKVEGFMTHPTALYKGVVLTACSRKVNDISKFKRHLKNKIFLYQVIFCSSFPVYNTLDVKTFLPIVLEEPIIEQDSYWIVRYAEI